MFGHDNIHSTLVAWLKIVLPLVALGILSTLFLVSRTINPEDAIPFAEVDVEERAREPRLTLPVWAGVTDDGAALTISADEARPNPQGESRVATATAMRAALDTPDGGKAEIRAEAGRLDQGAGLLTLEGGVTVTTSTGWQVTSQALTARLDRTGVESAGPISALGPAGRLEAARMEISADPARPGGYLMVFNGGVRLIYQPPAQESLP